MADHHPTPAPTHTVGAPTIGRLTALMLLAGAMASCGGGGGDAAGTSSEDAQARRRPSAPTPAPTPAPAPAPTPAPPAGTWIRVAGEGGAFVASRTTTYRYGTDTRWVERTGLFGTIFCTNTTFGDPARDAVKQCQMLVTSAPAPAPAPSPAPPPAPSPAPTPAPAPDHSMHGPTINNAMIPSGDPGVGTDRLSATGERPGASDGTGAFRTVCDFSHMAYDDPIVFPGQPGRSHLHAFFGNTGANGNSTAASIASSGNSTCRGGTINRSAYWVPAMIDTRDGRPLKPLESHFYYKTGYAGLAPNSINAFPPGLRMIAGDMTNASPSGHFRYQCVGGTGTSGYGIQNCGAGAQLWMMVFFPQCWNGRDLDSADHKSHMAYPSGGRCPSTHPVAVPEVTFNIVYPITEANAPLRWRLSSDMYDTAVPGGYSAHADWFNGWKPDIMNAWINGCDRPALDCRSHLLGDGRQMN